MKPRIILPKYSTNTRISIWSAIILLILCQQVCLIQSVKVIDNGLAPPEIVHTPISTKPKCMIHAAPLDLIFVLDSSGSLKNKFQDEIDVIRRIVKHVTIGETATRVMLIQFSGVQHLEFDFNKFTDRDELLSVLSVLRHVSGITRVGGAFEFTMSMLKNSSGGVRPANVPKIVYLLSDGRTHDFPKDSEMADEMRHRIPNIDIWAYGTGEYVAMSELIKITKDESKIVTNKNLDKLEPLFDQWHGTEVCDKQPVCVKGSDKPLDLALVIDSSESIEPIFKDQIKFAVERVVGNINVHPEAVRLALITFSGQAFLHFKFNDMKFGNNSAVVAYLNTLRPIKGTTSAHLALNMAFDLFTDRSEASQVRPDAGKLLLVITDGRSARSSHTISMRLRNEGISMMAVSMNFPQNTDEDELFTMTQDTEHVFTSKNIQKFEPAFLKFVGFGCPGMTLGPDAAPRVRGATDISCGPNSVTFTVRTQRPMSGLMYAQSYHDDPRCSLTASGNNRELTITFVEGNCGLIKAPAPNRDGYQYNITVILQFHPLIVTRADQGLDVFCFHAQSISPQEADRSSLKKLVDTQCTYRLHRFGPEDCMALDAKVGESLFHKWECDTPPNYRYLVHDCYGSSERKNVQILDGNGCEVDPHFLETPDYTHLELNSSSKGVEARGLGGYVFQEMSASDKCTKIIPPMCNKSKSITLLSSLSNVDTASGPKRRVKRGTTNIDRPKDGFALTINVETRTLNVIENEAIRPPTPVRYCDVRN
ncbi:von willebrand factor type A domain-containing protein [Ditylenchus destructor]|nr:von willebrand factor type A domain-containing protein [Ditylenchus destructor]